MTSVLADPLCLGYRGRSRSPDSLDGRRPLRHDLGGRSSAWGLPRAASTTRRSRCSSWRREGSTPSQSATSGVTSRVSPCGSRRTLDGPCAAEGSAARRRDRNRPRPPGSRPDEALDEKRARAVLAAILDGMPSDMREAFVLFELEQFNAAEVAEMLRIPVGTVTSRGEARASTHPAAPSGWRGCPVSALRPWSRKGRPPPSSRFSPPRRTRWRPRATRARVIGALGAGAALLGSSTTAATSSAAVALAKVVGVALLVGGTAGGAIVWHASRSPAPPASQVARAPRAVVAQAPARPPREETPPSRVVADPLEPSGKVTEPRPAAEQRRPQPGAVARAPAERPVQPSAERTLAIEVAALERAHDALAAGDPDGARRALDRYQSRFPHGELASEETLLRVQVLLALEDRDGAATLADSFVASHPGDPYARRVRDLVHVER